MHQFTANLLFNYFPNRLRKQAQEFASLDLVNAISKYDATINSIKAELNKMVAMRTLNLLIYD